MTTAEIGRQKAAETKRAATRAKAIKATDKLLRSSKRKHAGPPSVEEIAVEAGIGAATIYKTFGSRNRLFVETFKQVILKPLEEECGKLLQAEMAVEDRLRFYFGTLAKTNDKGRRNLHKAVVISRLDDPASTMAAVPGPDEDVDPEDDLIVDTIARHLGALAPGLYQADYTLPTFIAESTLFHLAQGAELAEDAYAAHIAGIHSVGMFWLAKKMGRAWLLDQLTAEQFSELEGMKIYIDPNESTLVVDDKLGVHALGRAHHAIPVD